MCVITITTLSPFVLFLSSSKIYERTWMQITNALRRAQTVCTKMVHKASTIISILKTIYLLKLAKKVEKTPDLSTHYAQIKMFLDHSKGVRFRTNFSYMQYAPLLPVTRKPRILSFDDHYLVIMHHV